MGKAPRSPNDQFRALMGEAGVSHKGLARRVVDLGATKGLRGLSYDHSSVIRWLAGEQPREPVPELIAEVLGGLLHRQVTVAELGMTPSAVAGDLGLWLPVSWAECVRVATTLWRADLERRRFLRDSALAVSASAPAALRWLVSPVAGLAAGTGRRGVGMSDVQAIREVARSYRELDNRLGGGRVRGAVVHYLDSQVTPLLTDGRYTEGTGRQLAGASAELAQLAGWMAYDAGLHGHAQRYLTQALGFARHAGDEGIGGEILAALAHQAVYLGRPADAVDLARAAQVTARRAGLLTLLTECYVMEAHGHAAADDAAACARALSDAEDAFGRATPANGPIWLAYFDEAYLSARMAHCFRDLGEARHAEQYARRSLDMDGRYVRGKAFNLSLLATALAQQDDIEQSCAIGLRAVEVAAGLHSARSIRYISDLQRCLSQRSDSPVVREFSVQVARRLPAASAHAAPR